VEHLTWGEQSTDDSVQRLVEKYGGNGFDMVVGGDLMYYNCDVIALVGRSSK